MYIANKNIILEKTKIANKPDIHLMHKHIFFNDDSNNNEKYQSTITIKTTSINYCNSKFQLLKNTNKACFSSVQQPSQYFFACVTRGLLFEIVFSDSKVLIPISPFFEQTSFKIS